MAKLHLRFDPEVAEVTRSRIHYTFQVFLAIYGHELGKSGKDADFGLLYGPRNSNQGSPPNKAEELRLCTQYRPRPPTEALTGPIGKKLIGDLEIPLFHSTGPGIDHLGEAFEWISLAHEHSVQNRDRVGRIAETHNIFQQFGISPMIPYASVIFDDLAKQIEADLVQEHDGVLRKFPPMPRYIIPSHDIDFHYTGPLSAIHRFSKNVVIAAVLLKSISFFRSNLSYLLKSLCGLPVAKYTGKLAAVEHERGFSADFYFLTGGRHRRDSNYTLQDAKGWFADITANGGNVGLHGSYCSIAEDQSLADEMLALKQSCKGSQGNRQHWLRFETHKRLYHSIEQARCGFDSTLGFSGSAGYRCGADFAFPPYDFENERPCQFIEIPLALMDTAVTALPLTEQSELANSIVQKKFGNHLSCVAILWHNPMEATAVTEETNRIFWDIAPDNRARPPAQKHSVPRWTSGAAFLNTTRQHYLAAGFHLANHS